jgi:putative tricarboxylic transport membrane protein
VLFSYLLQLHGGAIVKKGNMIISILFVLIGIYILIEVSTFPSVGGGQITGPDFFPRILAFTLIGLSVLLFISSIISKDESTTGLFDIYAIKAYITMIGLLVYMIVLNAAGFIIATPLFLIGLIRFYGMKHYPKLILSSVLVTGIIYSVFKLLLAVPLPAGILG